MWSRYVYVYTRVLTWDEAAARLQQRTCFHAYASERTYVRTTCPILAWLGTGSTWPPTTRPLGPSDAHEKKTDVDYREGQKSRPRGETRSRPTKKIREEWVATWRNRKEETRWRGTEIDSEGRDAEDAEGWRRGSWNESRKRMEFFKAKYISMLDFLHVASQANVRVNRMINKNWNFDREVEM